MAAHCETLVLFRAGFFTASPEKTVNKIGYRNEKPCAEHVMSAHAFVFNCLPFGKRIDRFLMDDTTDNTMMDIKVKVKVSSVAKQAKTTFLQGPTVRKSPIDGIEPGTFRSESATLTTAPRDHGHNVP